MTLMLLVCEIADKGKTLMQTFAQKEIKNMSDKKDA